VEVCVGNHRFVGFKPNLDRSLHDGHLCAAADRSSYLSNGVRHWWLCRGIFGTQTANACRVSASWPVVVVRASKTPIVFIVHSNRFNIDRQNLGQNLCLTFRVGKRTISLKRTQ